ncbi:hypothetical protein, partial [Paraburkholderia aspalathi]|uniref:hypothetical protein n=1 Tax=Paraburkholderia aspalathi TaxID=1324617 RepID=UPI001BA56A4A
MLEITAPVRFVLPLTLTSKPPFPALMRVSRDSLIFRQNGKFSISRGEHGGHLRAVCHFSAEK